MSFVRSFHRALAAWLCFGVAVTAVHAAQGEMGTGAVAASTVAMPSHAGWHCQGRVKGLTVNRTVGSS